MCSTPGDHGRQTGTTAQSALQVDEQVDDRLR
jgi:hypothetical protein